MKKYLACSLLMLLLSCFSINAVHAENAAPVKRQFKTWTVEKKTPVKSTTTVAAQPKTDVASAKSTPSQVKPVAVPANPVAVQPKPVLTTKRPAVQQQSGNNGQWKEKLSVKAKQKKEKNKKSSKHPVTNKSNGIEYTDAWRIKTSQQKLKQLGFLNETATGKMTPATKEAILSFQKKNDLSANGKLDDKTFRRIVWLGYSKNGIKGISGDAIVREASKYKGVPYVFGGITPKGFDCSGYVQYVFKQLHASLPRTADIQAQEGVFLTQSQLKPGDLVFFSTYEAGASHVGIYAGNGKFWNATSSKGIMLCGLRDYYWGTRYYGARRVLVSNGEPGL